MTKHPPRSVFLVLRLALTVAAVPAAILMTSNTAFAQPCFTAAQCAQIRMVSEQRIAEQRAAQAATEAAQATTEAARVRQEREAVNEAAKERLRQVAEQRQAQIEQERAQAQWQVEQARAKAEAEQQAQEAAVIQARQQAEQQAAYEEHKRQAIIEEENRAAAQLAAENSPDNHCHEKKIAGDLIDYFNGLQAASDVSARAVDIDHLTTIKFDSDHQVMACHGSFVLQSGVGITGTMTTRLNVAGRLLTEFHRD